MVWNGAASSLPMWEERFPSTCLGMWSLLSRYCPSTIRGFQQEVAAASGCSDPSAVSCGPQWCCHCLPSG